MENVPGFLRMAYVESHGLAAIAEALSVVDLLGHRYSPCEIPSSEKTVLTLSGIRHKLPVIATSGH